MDPFDEKNLDDFGKAFMECMREDREPAQWEPPKWIWTALVAMKVAALATAIAITAIILNN